MYFGWFFVGGCGFPCPDETASPKFEASFAPCSLSSWVLFVGVTSPGFTFEEPVNIVFSAFHLLLPDVVGDSEHEVLGSRTVIEPWLLYAEGRLEEVAGMMLSKQTNKEEGW